MRTKLFTADPRVVLKVRSTPMNAQHLFIPFPPAECLTKIVRELVQVRDSSSAIETRSYDRTGSDHVSVGVGMGTCTFRLVDLATLHHPAAHLAKCRSDYILLQGHLGTVTFTHTLAHTLV